MVKDLFTDFGFETINKTDDSASYILKTADHENKNNVIKVFDNGGN